MERREGSEQVKTPEILWSGGDVRLVSDTIFNPYDETEVVVECDTEDFPSPRLWTPQQIRRRANLSFRSQNAQSGLHADSSQVINEAIREYEKAIFSGNQSFEFRVPVWNHFGSPIEIEEGNGLARFYMEPERYVRNGELRKIVGKIENGKYKDIEIDGEEGIDWRFHEEINDSGQVDETGIELRIRDEGRLYIPEGSLPIKLGKDKEDYRRKLSRYLVDATLRDNLHEDFLWIGETAKLKMSKRVTAVIDRDAIHNSDSPNSMPGLHLESRLIDPGSAWPIRVEVISPLGGPRRVDWVLFRFYHKNLGAA